MRPPMPGIEVRNLALAGECGIGGDRGFEPALDLGAGSLQRRDHRAMAGGDLGIEGLGEAGLLHGDKLGQLAAARGKRLERDRFGRRRGAEALGHGASKARDEAGVQPVGLGDAPLGGAEGAHLARVGEADLEALRDQRRGQGPGIGADRLERDAAGAAPAHRLDQRRDAGSVVPDAQGLGGGIEVEVEKALADVDAGNGVGCEHVIPVLYAIARRDGDRPTVRIEHTGARGRASQRPRRGAGACPRTTADQESVRPPSTVTASKHGYASGNRNLACHFLGFWKGLARVWCPGRLHQVLPEVLHTRARRVRPILSGSVN